MKTTVIMWMCVMAGAIAGTSPDDGFSISFDRPIEVTAGGYARVRRIGAGRHALVYARGGAMRFRVSSDGCRTWSEETLVAKSFTVGTDDRRVTVFPANAEILRLKSGRLIYPFNWRPAHHRADLHPYEIAFCASDDDGRTWSAPRTLHSATNVLDGVMRGCYEPFVQEQGGKVRIFYADESPYVDGQRKYQEISYVESLDGGSSWSTPRKYCYQPQARDGMPVAMELHGHTYMAIESNGNGTLLHPEIVRDDGVRISPLRHPYNWRKIYAGAPYIARTRNFLLLSYQTSFGSATTGDHFSACEVVAMPLCEATNGTLTQFRSPTRPFAIDQTQDSQLWNALCPLDGDDFLVVTQHRGRILLTRGYIRPSSK